MRESEDDFEDEGAEGPPPPQSLRARARGNEGIQVGRIAATIARIEECEDMLAAGTRPRRVATALSSRWGIGRVQAQEYVNAVIMRWKREGATEDRETKRARMRAQIERTYLRSMSHKRAITVGDGGGEQHVELFDEPNFNAALQALELICKLDGLMEQQEASGSVTPQALLVALHNHYYGDAGPPEVTARVIDAKAEDE